MQTMGQLEVSPVYFVTAELCPLAMTCFSGFALHELTQANHHVCVQPGRERTTIMQACFGAHQMNARTIVNSSSSCFFVKRRFVQTPGCQRTHRLLNSANVLWCGAAAAAHNVDQAFGRKLMQQAAGDIGRFIKAGIAHRVGQAGVGVATDEGVAGHFGQLLNIGAH